MVGTVVSAIGSVSDSMVAARLLMRTLAMKRDASLIKLLIVSHSEMERGLGEVPGGWKTLDST